LFLIPEKSEDYDGFLPNTLKGVHLRTYPRLRGATWHTT